MLLFKIIKGSVNDNKKVNAKEETIIITKNIILLFFLLFTFIHNSNEFNYL